MALSCVEGEGKKGREEGAGKKREGGGKERGRLDEVERIRYEETMEGEMKEG